MKIAITTLGCKINQYDSAVIQNRLEGNHSFVPFDEQADCYVINTCTVTDRADADAIFISCGALRSIEIIDELEQLAGKPVITSNQAMAWDVMRLAGIEDRVSGYGRLLGEK